MAIYLSIVLDLSNTAIILSLSLLLGIICAFVTRMICTCLYYEDELLELWDWDFDVGSDIEDNDPMLFCESFI